MYKYRLINNMDGNFAKQWIELEKRSINSNICNVYNWYLVHSKTFPSNTIEFHTCYMGARLVAILPLIKTKQYGITVKSSLSNQHIIDTPFLLENYDAELIKCLFSNVIKSNNIYIPRIEASLAVLIKKIYPESMLVLMSASPYIDNVATNPFKYISSSNLSDLRRINRKNESIFSHICYTCADNLDQLLDTVFHIDQTSAKYSKNKSLFTNELNRKFYNSLINVYCEIVQISFVYKNNLPIGYTLGLTYKNKFIGYQTSYLREFKQLSPGKLAIYYLLEKFRNSNIELFDFCSGMASYKLEFTNKYALQYDLLFSKNRSVMALWRLIVSAGRLKKQLVQEKYTKDTEFLFRTL